MLTIYCIIRKLFACFHILVRVFLLLIMAVDFFKENSKNNNTTKATNSWHKNFVKWAESTDRPTNVEAMEKPQLNSVLEIYFSEVVWQNGQQYEPSSLSNMQAGIDRYLKEKGCTFSIIKDREFLGSQNVLEGRAKYCREELGMGITPNATSSFTAVDNWLCTMLRHWQIRCTLRLRMFCALCLIHNINRLRLGILNCCRTNNMNVYLVHQFQICIIFITVR